MSQNTKQIEAELRESLLAAAKDGGGEIGHMDADDALLKALGDFGISEEVLDIFRGMMKYYA